MSIKATGNGHGPGIACMRGMGPWKICTFLSASS